MSRWNLFRSGLLAGLLVFGGAARSFAYSVLAHEANVDLAWDRAIKPLLLERFPHADAAALSEARAYAYGGSVIQDLGYYPFGNHFFTNVVHYVRSGDFVETLVRDADTLDEFAFALGALSHYAADTVGHPDAVNPSVPLIFPKLGDKYGPRVTYAQSPASHVIAEFSFDVVQVAAGRYAPDAYHRFIGFAVAKPLLERAFRETYNLDLDRIFGTIDLAIGTYRRAISEIIPHLTQVAWHDKHDEIVKVIPAAQERTFVFRMSRAEYERAWGTDYRRPGLLARFVAVVYKLVPKIGPLRPLQFKAPPRQAEQLFVHSLDLSQQRYRSALAMLRRGGGLQIANLDFDTGRRPAHGEYALADRTYADLLDRLSEHHYAGMSTALRDDILRFYGGVDVAPATHDEQSRIKRMRVELAAVGSVPCR